MVKTKDENEATARIEAALYSAGRPLTIEEIIKASGTESRTKTGELLLAIMKKTKSAFKALEITTLPDGSYVFCLDQDYFISLENIIGKYEDLIVKKIQNTGSGLLNNIVSELEH